MLLAIWTIAVLCIGIWSLACWGVNYLLTLEPGRFQDIKPLIEQLPYSEEFDRWLPGWQTLLQFLLDLTQGLVAGINNAAPWLAWALWATGSGLTLLLAALASAAVVMLRNDNNKPQPPALPLAR